ncbi:MAG: hypothetical protein K2L15_04675 [Eubacteriales bacterium]|nr:hypothetical protein [Eubacteriales bacterium]
MKFSRNIRNIFEEYFKPDEIIIKMRKKIGVYNTSRSDYVKRKKEKLKNELGLYEEDFHIALLKEFESAFETKDGEMIEYLIISLALWEGTLSESNEDRYNYFIDILNKLVICDWHKGNEDIVNFLQDIADEKSIDYLYRAVSLDLEYLAWDTENYTFKVKCVKAIREIGRKIGLDRVIDTLNLLCDNENSIVREVAEQSIEKLKNREKRY